MRWYALSQSHTLPLVSTKTVTQEQLDAIVGAALRGLVQANASNSQIGRFAVEHRLEMAQVLGVEDSRPVETDLQSLVMAAVTTALADFTATNQPTRKRYNVTIGGKRTTLTLKSELVEKAKEQLGRSGAKTLISNLAEASADSTENRSMQVEHRLKVSLEEIERSSSGGNLVRH